MFLIEISKSDAVPVYRLKNTKTQEYAELIPACGAILNALVVSGAQGLYNCIDGFIDYADFITHNARSFKSNLLFPFPNRIKDGRYEYSGIEYQLPINFPDEQNAIHGFVYDKEFMVEDCVEQANFAAIELVYATIQGEQGFPFSFMVRVRYEFSEKGLELQTTITNTGQEAFPFGFGWHHYMSLGERIDSYALSFPAECLLHVDDRSIPTGEEVPYTAFNTMSCIEKTVLDTCFSLQQNTDIRINLTHAQKGRGVFLCFSSADFPYLQVYTPPHRNSIAIEPMTCPPDAFNNKKSLRIAKPHESYCLDCRIEWLIP